MATALKLSVEQVTAAITLLDLKERQELRQQLVELLPMDAAADMDDLAWTSLAESALDFWLDPAEDIYADLVAPPSTNGE